MRMLAAVGVSLQQAECSQSTGDHNDPIVHKSQIPHGLTLAGPGV
jgi:hypothetical protein